MKVERILSESDLLQQRIQATSRRQREGVLSEDAVEFEGKEQRKENPEHQYPAYGPKKPLILPLNEEIDTKKDELDVIA